MVRKISLAVLSVAILVTGILAFRNLNYWERSVMIFKLNSNQPFTREMGRGRGGFGERERTVRPEGFNRAENPGLTDNIGERHDAGRNFRMLPDSLRQNNRMDDFRGEGGSFRVDDYHDRRDRNFRGRRPINLGTVGWFLAVFALFTLVTLGIEKGWKLIRSPKPGNISLRKKPEETVNQ